jgi:hypothetical protein
MIFHPFLVEIKQLFHNNDMLLYCQPWPIFRQATMPAKPRHQVRRVVPCPSDFKKGKTVIVKVAATVN